MADEPIEKQVDDLIAGYNQSVNDDERETWLEAFTYDLALVEELIKRQNAAKKVNDANA